MRRFGIHSDIFIDSRASSGLRRMALLRSDGRRLEVQLLRLAQPIQARTGSLARWPLVSTRIRGVEGETRRRGRGPLLVDLRRVRRRDSALYSPEQSDVSCARSGCWARNLESRLIEKGGLTLFADGEGERSLRFKDAAVGVWERAWCSPSCIAREAASQNGQKRKRRSSALGLVDIHNYRL